MHKSPHILVALYDAHPEHAHLLESGHASKAHALGAVLGKAGFGIIARAGSPVVTTALSALADAGVAGIALSPAMTRGEHDIAYRLPHLGTPTIFTGRGALGADTVALSSSHAVVIVGSHPEILASILEHVKEQDLPVGILSEESGSDIHERVRNISPNLSARLFVSSDPEALVGLLSGELRRRRLSERI